MNRNNIKFEVNKKMKKNIRKSIIQNHKLCRILNRISTIFALVCLFGSIIYVAVNLLVPGLSIVNVNGIPTKDMFLISFVSIYLLLFGTLIYLCIKTFVYRISGVSTSNRTNEELYIKNNVLQYIFRMEHIVSSSRYERNLVYIPLDKIKDVTYDKSTRKIVFTGTFSATYKQFDKKVQMVPCDGQCCGAKRPRCGAERPPFSLI